MIEETIMQRLELQRAKKEMTIEQFAEFLNMSKRTYKDYKKKGCKLSHDELFTVSEKLGCSIDYLYGIDEHETRKMTDVCKVTGLSENAIKAITRDGFNGELGYFINSFADNALFNRFADAFVNADYLAQNVTERNKDAYLDESLIFENGEGFDLTIRKTMLDAVHDVCRSMCDAFNDFAHFYFDRKAVIHSQITVEEIIPTEADEDSEVR